MLIDVPQSFLEQPRWWHDEAGRSWLDELPDRVAAQCAAWGLAVDGEPRHGANALVVPVRRDDEPYALRLSPPGDDVATEAATLRFWDGRGTVRLIEADHDRRALLLERLDGERSLLTHPLEESVEIIGGLIRQLAVPVPAALHSMVPSTTAVVSADLEGFPAANERCGRPLSDLRLASVIKVGTELAGLPLSSCAVDGDLHFEQVLAGQRQPWVVVDPILLRGDPAYDLGRVMWSRLDELPDDKAITALLGRLADAAGIDHERARHWVVHRAASYLFWGLEHGLTIDPPRCLRLLDTFLPRS